MCDLCNTSPWPWFTELQMSSDVCMSSESHSHSGLTSPSERQSPWFTYKQWEKCREMNVGDKQKEIKWRNIRSHKKRKRLAATECLVFIKPSHIQTSDSVKSPWVLFYLCFLACHATQWSLWLSPMRLTNRSRENKTRKWPKVGPWRTSTWRNLTRKKSQWKRREKGISRGKR